MRHPPHSTVALLAAVWFATLAGQARAATPLPVPSNQEWRVDSIWPGISLASGSAVAFDSKGNLYVAVSGQTETQTVRALLKYEPSGKEVAGPNGYFFSDTFERKDLFLTQALVLDEPRRTGYVLVTQWYGGAASLHVFSHDLESGRARWTARLGAALDWDSRLAVDGYGNVWVARNSTADPARFQLDQVRGPRDIRHQEPMAGKVLAMACAGKRLYVAYSNTGADLGVSVFDIAEDGELRPVASKSFTWELPEPLDEPPSSLPPDTNARHSPIFTHGTIDGAGNFQVAGFYTFLRQGRCSRGSECGTRRRYYPVLATVSPTAELITLYIESGTSKDAWLAGPPDDVVGWDWVSGWASVTPSSDKRALVMISSGSAHPGSSRVWEVQGTKRIAAAELSNPTGERMEYPVGSGCWWEVYLAEPSVLASQVSDTSVGRTAGAEVLSLFRTSDDAGSCQGVPQRLSRLSVASFSGSTEPAALSPEVIVVVTDMIW